MNFTQIYTQRQSQICESSVSHGGETEDAVVLVYDILVTGNWFPRFEEKFTFAMQEKNCAKSRRYIPDKRTLQVFSVLGNLCCGLIRTLQYISHSLTLTDFQTQHKN